MFEPALEQGDDRRLAAADRTHQQENALAHLEPLRGGFEVLDDLGDRLLNPEKFFAEELIAHEIVCYPLDVRCENHFTNARM